MEPVRFSEVVCIYTEPGSLMREPEDVKILVCVDDIPEDMGRFVNLEYFSICGETKVLDFPDTVYDIPTLKHLHIEGKVNVEEPFALEDMDHLKSLTIENLEDEEFKILYVGALDGLEFLCIKNSQLALSGLINLKYNLKHLIIRNTDMEFLPRSVYRLWKLRTLDISENSICNVSRRIMDLVNLKNFAWSHKTRPDAELVFSGMPDQLPDYFHDLMKNDISRKTLYDFTSEIYDQENVPPMMEEIDDDEDFDTETIFDNFLNVDEEDFDEFGIEYSVDEGYSSGEDEEDDGRVVYNISNEPRAEFQIDYMLPKDKRVPDWEFLYDESDSSDSESDEDGESEYDSDFERDYENERMF
jgi:hypothetical protein